MTTMEDEALKAAVRGRALEEGFDVAGFAAARAGAADRGNLLEFLARGFHGGMEWMAGTAERRADPRALWPEARTAIVLGINYRRAGDPLALRAYPERGAIAVYARGRDYHDILKKRLKRLARWLAETHGGAVKVFVDTAPLMEKSLAARAGLGWQGKHTNLVSRRFGSWLLLGELLTTLELPPDSPEPDRCGSCTRCLDACPTGALFEPYRIDARRCLSYLTIEHQDELPDDLARRMGNRIFGCDDCLAACPWNKFSRPAGDEAFQPSAALMAPRLADLLDLDEDAFRLVFAGSPVKRTGRRRLLRNVRAALVNRHRPE